MDSLKNYPQSQDECQIIKPSVKTFLLLVHSFGLTILIFLPIAWIFLGPAVFVIGIFFGGKGIGAVIVSALLLYFITMMIIYFFRRASLKRTEYRFYSDKVEYFEGFLIKNRKTLTYDKVSNVGQRKGVIEGWFGLGTVYLDTPGSSPQGHEMSMAYLENPEQVYNWVSKVVSRKR